MLSGRAVEVGFAGLVSDGYIIIWNLLQYSGSVFDK